MQDDDDKDHGLFKPMSPRAAMVLIAAVSAGAWMAIFAAFGVFG